MKIGCVGCGGHCVFKAAGHHPDVHVTRWRHVEIVLTTHSVGGLTTADLSLAKTIDSLECEYSPKWAREVAALDADAPGDERCVEFDASHYASGLNGDFTSTQTTREELVSKFAGAEGGGGKFEDVETRDIAAAKEELVAALRAHAGLGAGSVVADVGSGTGLLLGSLSRVVGETGSVLASELAPLFREELARRASREGLDNVVVVEAPDSRDPKLPPRGVDVALLVDVYHHLEFPRTVLRRLRAALKKNGALVVVDFHRDPERIKSHDAAWVMTHLRADQATFRAEIQSAGFVHCAEPFVLGLPENYMMIFKPLPALLKPGAGWAESAPAVPFPTHLLL